MSTILFFKFFHGDYTSGINNHLKTIWEEFDMFGMIAIGKCAPVIVNFIEVSLIVGVHVPSSTTTCQF
jgi:hypothetical protein